MECFIGSATAKGRFCFDVDTTYNANITNIQIISMSPKSSEAFKVLRLEIRQTPKMAFLEDLVEVSAIPEEPAVLIVDAGSPNVLPPISRLGMPLIHSSAINLFRG